MGLGQLVNRDYKKVVIFWSVYAILYIYNLFVLRPVLLVGGSPSFLSFFTPEFLIWVIILVVAWLWSIEDAWRVGCRKEKKQKKT